MSFLSRFFPAPASVFRELLNEWHTYSLQWLSSHSYRRVANRSSCSCSLYLCEISARAITVPAYFLCENCQVTWLSFATVCYYYCSTTNATLAPRLLSPSSPPPPFQVTRVTCSRVPARQEEKEKKRPPLTRVKVFFFYLVLIAQLIVLILLLVIVLVTLATLVTVTVSLQLCSR